MKKSNRHNHIVHPVELHKQQLQIRTKYKNQYAKMTRRKEVKLPITRASNRVSGGGSLASLEPCIIKVQLLTQLYLHHRICYIVIKTLTNKQSTYLTTMVIWTRKLGGVECEDSKKLTRLQQTVATVRNKKVGIFFLSIPMPRNG